MKRNPVLIIMAAIGLLAGSAQARLGLTREQCDEYYKVTGEQYSWGSPLSWFEYKFGVFTIDIAFINDKAVSITYANHSGGLTNDMVSVLLDTGGISRGDLKEDFVLEKAQFDASHPRFTLWTSPRYPGVIVSLMTGKKSGYELVSVTTEESRAATKANLKETARTSE
jgi:hypothetical protein